MKLLRCSWHETQKNRKCAVSSTTLQKGQISVLLFLVGAFLKKRARLLQSLVFFYLRKDSKRRTLKVKINVQLLKVQNYWTAKGKHGERIHSLFQRYIQARTGLKFRTPPPFRFFFRRCEIFFRIFLMSPKGPPFEFFCYFATECVFINQKGSPLLHFPALCDIFRKKFFFLKFQVFFQKKMFCAF